jgi:hypothetical protein
VKDSIFSSSFDLAIPIQRKGVHVMEGQEVGWFSCPKMWFGDTILHPAADYKFRCCASFYCLQNTWMYDNLGMVITYMVIGDLYINKMDRQCLLYSNFYFENFLQE